MAVGEVVPVVITGAVCLEQKYLVSSLGDKTARCPEVGRRGFAVSLALPQQGLSLRASISPVFSQHEEHPGTQRCFQELFPAMAFWPELSLEPMAGWRGGAIRFSAGQVKVLEMPSSWALQLGHPMGCRVVLGCSEQSW